MLFTRNLLNHEKLQDRISDLWVSVIENYNSQPDQCLDGGNDKNFFSFTFNGVKLFACRNESGRSGFDGLTIMLPEDY